MGWRLFFNWLPPEAPFQVIGSVLAVLAGFLFQAALIAEAAHVVWLRRTDKIKLRVEQDSGWWRVMVVVLGILVAFDFVLLFMAMSGARDLVTAWNLSSVDQLTWFSTFGLLIMNLLTLLRCASVMNTSTTELNRRAVEERTKAIAEEILIDAGDATRSEALRVWRQLGTSPQKFIPLNEAVLGLIQRAHPDFFPDKLGGDTWAYDVSSNSFTAITPNLHTSLLAARDKRDKLGDMGAHLWGMGPEELAEAVSYNLKSYGKPRFVDFTVPDEPLYSFQPPAPFEKVFNVNAQPLPQSHTTNHRQTQAGSQRPTVGSVGIGGALRQHLIWPRKVLPTRKVSLKC